MGVRLWVLSMAALACPPAALAQTVSIDAGGHWRAGDATIDFDCANVTVHGRLDVDDSVLSGVRHLSNAGSIGSATGAIEIGGDWINDGQFSAGSGSVHVSDRCDEPQATIHGMNQFATLDIESSRGKRYHLTAGQTQSVSNAFRLIGAPGARIVLRSTQAGAQSRIALAPGGTQLIDWIDVADQVAPPGSQWLAAGEPALFNAIDAGNNVRWFGAPTVEPAPVPATSSLLILVLSLLVVCIGGLRLRLR